MQKVWEVIDDDTGVVRIAITADSTVQAITISNTPNWLDHASIERITSLLNIAATWLNDNKEA